jgi:hypothetical protein|tara:strand:+ start:902 stop:2062 length:1161 start_codon:yes stop_codon:yes gene_type:complete
MENTIQPQEEQFQKAEIFDTPEQLAASMAQGDQPQVGSQPEQPAETPYVDPEPAPTEEPSTLEQIAQPEGNQQEEYIRNREYYQNDSNDGYEEDYSDEEIEAAVYTYLSERLGREINSFDELSQNNTVDERVQAIADFVQETGRNPEDWFTYQSMNTSEMDDLTAVRVQMSQDYPNLSFEEINMLVGSKYKLDPNVYDERDVQLSTLQLKIDAEDARGGIEKIREQFKAPAPREEQGQYYDEDAMYIDDAWMQNMATETDAMEALEFDLGGDRTFTYSLGDDHRRRLIQRNSQLDNFFDNYVYEDGSWDYDKLNSHFAVIDNIDTIVSSAYRQGLGDGQKAVVSNAANVSMDTSPSSSQNLNQENPLAAQVRDLLRGNSSKMTFKI